MRCVMCIVMVVILAGCIDRNYMDKGEYVIDKRLSSKSQNERVRFLVFHYTAVNDTKSLHLLTEGEASAHFLIPLKPNVGREKKMVLQLVDENKRAWHAGVSFWNGRHNLNDSSIGIEIVNNGFIEENGARLWYQYDINKINVLSALSRDLIERFSILPENVVGHSDISPSRKSDPGPLFPWQALAERGIGAWPDQRTVDEALAGRDKNSLVEVSSIQSLLSHYGYKIPQHGCLDDETKIVITAFQMHFRPEDITGKPDAETESIAKALVIKYKNSLH